MTRSRYLTVTLSVFLLGVVLFDMLGTPLMFYLIQRGIKKEMKRLVLAQIPNEKLTVIDMPAGLSDQTRAGFVWIEPHEFTYKGKMYDIVRSVSSGDSVRYFCVNDTDEEKLIETYAKQTKQKKPASTPATSILISIFVSSFGINELKCFCSDELIGTVTHNFQTLPGETDPPEPPPRYSF